MFKTKLEVDKHVNNCLKKITNDTERNLRCFSFAKLYYNVGDYEHAYRYATSYLSVKSKSAEGHLLLGKSLEKLGKYEAALEAYRNSLQADPKQNNLVLKVCELLSSDNIDMDLSGARYFCELAQSIAPDNPSVFALKEKLICIEHENPTEVARLLLEELERRPTDVSLRTRLLRHFVRHNMITEAYKHASSIEDSAAHAPDSGQSRCDFFNNLMWYETFYEVLSKYRKARSSEINEAFWLKFVSVCERVADLSLQEYRLGEGTKTKGVPEYVQTVLNLDETLNEAYRFVNSTSSDRSATKVFFEQYRAQLYFHLATLVYKQAKRDILDFKEASNVVLPLLFVAYHTNPPESNNRLYKLACYRNSQTGHILLSLSKDGKSLLLEKAAQYSTGTWRENLYKKLFGRRDLTASFFLNQLLTEPVNKLPIIDDLLTYDTVALKLYPDSLHHYVWVMMNDNVPVNIRLVPFDGLLYSTANLSNCAAESLNYLDVYSFVCCATFCSTIGHSNRRLLPANITDNLVTVEQSKFMLGAYKMYQNDRSTDTGDLRMLLIKGIEVTRCIGQHGLDAKLLVSLGELLEERAKKLDKRSEVELTLDRAELYWSTGLSLLDRIVNEEAVVHSNNRLFAYKSDLTSQEARSMINKGKLFLAVRTFEKNRLEQALAMLKELKDPYASYHQYEIYKKMSDANANANTKTSLLTLARDSLYLTLDRLREQPYTYSHPLNLELGTKITEIEQQLDLTGVYDRELDLNMTGLSLSNDAYSTPARPSNKQASLREECRPSPERLDAQIRQLACSKDASFTIVSEQNRMVVDMQKCLLDKLNRVIDELKDIKGDVEALKERAKTEAGAAGVHADDIQNMMDVIQEIRKDLNEVKKNDSRNNQLSDEDLYVLDPDYGVDYNLSGNMAGTSMYGNFPTPRMPNPNHLAAYGQSLMYPGLYPGGLTYPYGALNFVQPGPLPFLPDHQQPPLSTSAAAAAPSNLLSQPIGPNQTKFLPTADVATSSRVNQIAAPPALSLPAPASVATPTPTPSAPARPNPTTPLFGKGAPVNVVITTSDPLPNRSALTAQQPVLSVTIPPQHVKSNSGKAAAAATPSKGDGGTADGAESAADGEENEEVVFCKRAKLFNYVTVDGKKEWKERGTGELKVLRNKSTGKSRILMRRERTRKICANHFVRDDTHLVRPNNNDLSFIWLAHDYSDGTAAAAPPRPETFHVKFAAADEATAFYDAVESVKSSTVKSGTRPVDSTKTSAKDDAESAGINTASSTASKSSMGGFVFTGTPTFKPKELAGEAPTTAGVADVEPAGTKTGTPFVSFVFGKAIDEPKKTFAPLVIARENDDDGGDKEDKVEEFVPTAEFKPVVPLPDIVEVKTGEEGAEVLFEARTKLFRYVTNEWKERGLGCLKVLKDNDSIRLLMRRDQVHKICCNHRVLKDMPFKLKSDNPKAVMWSAQDFSEEELKLETFTARFRSEEIAAEFIRILSDNQLKLDENNSFGTTPQKIVPTASIARNAAATTGVIDTTTTTTTTTVVGQKTVPSFSEGFGDSFKPKPGSWECEVCLVRNDNSNGTCTACETPKEGGTNASKSVLGTTKIDCKWSFGVPAQTVAAASPFGTTAPSESKTNDFGDKFKPAFDTWECGTCLVRNDNSTRTCTACNTTKAGGTDAAAADCKWTFGVPNQSGTISTVANLFGQTPAKSERSTEKFFGKQTSAVDNLFAQKLVPDTTSSPMVFTANVFGQKDTTSTTPLFSSGGIFGQKDATSTTPVLSADGIFGQKAVVPLFGEKTPTAGLFGQKAVPANLFGTAGTASDSPKEGYVFGAEHKGGEFEFKQRTPRRVSGGESDGGNADDSVVEEEEEVNIYFKPVVPLPDKVEVRTGEEDADALFARRAKLYRFVDGEWKERGIGDVKLLRDRASRRLRVVMRREQVLKVCLNHALDANVEYVPKDERSFVFGVADFSDGEMSKERLCLRFKNAEVAGEFKRAVDEAVGNCTASADASFRSTEDDDVIVVSETRVTPEEEKFAKSLGLPAKFLAYKQLPDCACAQCKKDDDYLKELFASDSKSAQSSTTAPGKSSFALKPPTLAQPKSTPEPAPAPPKFSFSSPNMAAFGTTPTTVIPFGSSGSNASSGSFGTPLSSTGNLSASPAPSTGSSLFGTPVSSTTSLFGTNSNRIFGNGAPPTGGSIFGGGTTYNSPSTTTTAATAVGSTTNLFGSSSTTSNTGLFGGTTFNSPSTTTAAATTVGSTTNLFGSSGTTSNSGIFGTAFNSPSTTTAAATTVGSTTNLFGSNSTASNTGIFGGIAFNSPSTTTVGSTTNLFGSSSTSSNTSIFGGTNFSFAPPSKPFQPATTTGTALFGGVSKASSTVATSADADEIVLKCDTNLSFSSLASSVKIDAKPSFTMKTVTDETFSFLGAGAPVFQSTAGKGTANGKDDADDNDDEGGTNDDYDPHYEPIVPLPEQIVVTTGEEDEDALFNDRAKLFRYVADTKEWKERGVGQLKVLYHREKHTYRLLLRREQVHKLVLNQLVTKDLELKAMTTEKSWMWVGHNFVDDETNLEKLAVRFKKPETALEFRTVVERATEQLRLAETEEKKKSKANESGDGDVPVTVSNFGEGHYEGYYEEANRYSEGEEDDDDVEEEEDDEKTIMFVKECTLSERLRDDGDWQEIGKGDLQVYYDPDVFGARIQVNDEYGKVMSVTLIGINTIMELGGNECTWKAREWTTDMQMRNLKATFADESAAQEFHSNYFEGLNYAQQVGLVDESPVQCASDDTDE